MTSAYSQAKTAVLKSFAKFLHDAIEQPSQESLARAEDPSRNSFPLWYLSRSFNSQEAFASFADILSSQHSRRKGCDTRLWSEADEDEFLAHFPLALDDDDGHTKKDNDLDIENILGEINRLTHDGDSSEHLDSMDGRLLHVRPHSIITRKPSSSACSHFVGLCIPF